MFYFYNNRILGDALLPVRFEPPEVWADVRSVAVVLVLLVHCLFLLLLFVGILWVVLVFLCSI